MTTRPPAATAGRAVTGAPAWARAARAVAEDAGVDPGRGLGEEEAASRLRAHGPGELPRERDRSLLASVLAQLRETMILVLLGAAALTAVTGDLADTGVILLVIAVNTTVGVIQERRAVGAVAALRALTVPEATVVRDGVLARVPTPQVVPGDLLRVAEGDVVGADARLLAADALQVDESVLTGESQPADRRAEPPCPEAAPVAERVTMLHAGTLVVHGTGTAVAVATGPDTELGRIAGMLRGHPAPPTPLQRRLTALGRRLSVGIVATCALVVALGLARGEPWELMVVSGISLAVAAIPESLPAVVALALAAATRRMAARGAIVRSLPAVEALGSVTVLATDKTGTLTTGHPAAVACWTPADGEHALDGTPVGGPGIAEGGRGSRALLEAAVLCSDAAPGAGGTEGALVTAAAAAGVDVAGLRAALPRTGVEPFDTVRRSMRTDHPRLTVVKGAPEVVVGRSGDGERVAAAWAGTGRRVLGVAAGPPGAPAPLGLLATDDPVREDAPAAIRAARAAGIRTIMITGDHPGTAASVAARTGVTDPAEPPDRNGAPAVYARTDPAGKLRIVAELQEAGELVAMTGDGVNDAPALRAADVGVAMGRRGTEVAKQAADLVLADDGLGTLVAAVAEGRRVFDNVRRFVRYGLSGGLAELLVMLLGPLLGFALPLLPGQILWVNLVTHGLPGVAIGSEVAEPDVLRRPPRPPREGLLDRRGALDVLGVATLITMGSLGLAVWAAGRDRPWQTLLFATLALTQLGVALTTRSDRIPFWRMSPRGNPFLFLAVATSLAATLAAIYLPGLSTLLGTHPLTPVELGLAAAVAVVPAVTIELVELRRARRQAASPG